MIETLPTEILAKLILLDRRAIRRSDRDVVLKTLRPFREMRSSGDVPPPICKRGRLKKRPFTRDPLIDAEGSRASDKEVTTIEFETEAFAIEKDDARTLPSLLL